uniref:hypothetical protein n=1 Tax=Flavobacterium sp. TaxID=239 RepID=UPI004048DC4B
ISQEILSLKENNRFRSSQLMPSVGTLYVIMKEETEKQLQEKYRITIEEKTNSVIEVLKGADFNQIKYILDRVNNKVENTKNELTFLL